MSSIHPEEETIARYAAGTLMPGMAVVVAAHLEACPHCRASVRDFEAVGGALLEDEPLAALAEDALARSLAAIDAGPPRAQPFIARPKLPEMAPGLALPRALEGCAIGKWRWMGPGMRYAKVKVPGDTGTSVILLSVPAGRPLPEHGHSGRELTLVLQGAFRDGGRVFRPGDLVEEDDTVEHQPVVTDEGRCICLAAVEGRMRLTSPIARVMQTIMGI